MLMQGSVSLRYRIFIFAVLWIAAGLICATFADIGGIEAGDTELGERANIALIVPFCVTDGLSFVVFRCTYSLSHPDLYRQIAEIVLPLLFLAQAIASLTRKSASQFRTLIILQTLMLTGGTASFHWDTIHLHG